MKRHYHRVRGYRRYPGPGGRPVYYMPMDEKEVRERHFLYGILGTLVGLIGILVLWVVNLI